MRKRGVTTAIIVAVILVVGAVIYFYPRTTGDELLEYLQWDNIETVTIKKTEGKEIDSTTVATRELTEEELSSFCELFRGTKLKSFNKETFRTSSDTKYYISLLSAQGYEVCEMKLYNDEYLMFDYLSREDSREYRRYKITGTALVGFFEEILEK